MPEAFSYKKMYPARMPWFKHGAIGLLFQSFVDGILESGSGWSIMLFISLKRHSGMVSMHCKGVCIMIACRISQWYPC